MDPGHAAAQTSLHLTPSRLHVTSEDNFWTSMLRAGLQSCHDVQACTSASVHPVAEQRATALHSGQVSVVSPCHIPDMPEHAAKGTSFMRLRVLAAGVLS